MSMSLQPGNLPGSSSVGNTAPDPSATLVPGVAQTGQKRTADRRESPLDDAPGPSKKTRHQKGKGKAKVDQYHLVKAQIPVEHRPTKKAVYLHVYTLLGVTRADQSPLLPTADVVALFEDRLEPGFVEKIRQTLRETSSSKVGAVQMVNKLREMARDTVPSGSNIAKDILRVKDTLQTAAFTAVLMAGLQYWCPDCLAPPDTPYNQVHELVFLETFRAIPVSTGFRFYEVLLSSVTNPQILLDFYPMCVFDYMAGKVKREQKEPGKLVQNRINNNAIKGRQRLALKRTGFLAEDKWPDRVIDLVRDPHCNSDDESASDGEGGRIHRVAKKGIRSESATLFIHAQEMRRLKNSQAKRGKRKVNLMERTRVRSDDAEESDISFHIPKKAPIDWFDPAEFNDFPASLRFQYSKYGVALPLPEYHSRTDWKTMNKDTFMTAYGDEVLKQYNIPTEEEMRSAGNQGWEVPPSPKSSEEDLEDAMDQAD
ncbi:hypothetical protein GGX14DRAFT_453423 [Mycena pura]|uniref:Uncharacterized protein n=1 Tax=Mycena pura TaxID=153505 RepID=A0AAD6VCW7_9AGAR|nr:hypothetical protein GGX14DRAFT_453423 [Mycena pura]